ncbi:MAG: hypothetical protein IPN88_09105 [Bacteroidetes bacterium]|nr:hypothetical protein [Bacteroidota bacterium]
MKALFLICSGLLFIALLALPIGYFTFLRIMVTIGSVTIIYSEMENGLNIWVISFGIIAILFNPIIPIYLNSKSAWMPIDLICGILFLIKALTFKQK